MTTIFAGCGEKNLENEQPPLVKTQKISAENYSTEKIYSGVVKGRYETKLAFQVGGKIISRNVEVGDKVFSGKILLTIDAKDILEQNKNAEAQVSAALAQLNLAKSNFERYSELFSENAVAEATLENFKTQYDAAVANYNSAKAQAEQNKNFLEYTNLVANADGIISEINAEVGQVVSAGQNILTLVRDDNLEVEINIPENKISEIKLGDECEIKFWANEEILRGEVREISPMADATSRTYAVKIKIPEKNFVKLGMTASATFFEKSLRKIKLPMSAIYQTGEEAQVWVVEGGKVRLKKINVEKILENEVEVSGIKFGETVVTAGVHKLREGEEVRTE